MTYWSARRGLAVGVVGAISLTASCSQSAAPRTTTTGATVRGGQSLGLWTVAYLASNRAATPFTVNVRGPANLVVGRVSNARLTFAPLDRPVWVAIRAQRLTVRERDGRGSISVATNGCAKAPGTACDARLVYTATGYPIAPAPGHGMVVRGAFTLRLTTDRVQPGHYDIPLAAMYPKNATEPAALTLTDTLRVQLDVTKVRATNAPCTIVDLHKRPPAAPTPHALRSTVVVAGGRDRLDPPPPNFHPRVSASRAVRLLYATHDGNGRASVVLASYSAAFPRRQGRDGIMGPEIHDVVVWALYTYHDAVSRDSFIGPSRGGQSTGAVPAKQPACIFLDGLSAIDATTGKALTASGFGSENNPSEF